MTIIKNTRDFMASLSEGQMSDDEMISEFSKYVKNNCGELDAEFSQAILTSEPQARMSLVEDYAYKGAPAAQLSMGALKLAGKSIQQNIPEGIFWLKRAYLCKNPNAGLMLFVVYSTAIGVSKDLVKAREYLTYSADLGLPKAQYYLAIMLLEGQGGAMNEEQAIDLMSASASKGHTDARAFLQANGLHSRISTDS